MRQTSCKRLSIFLISFSIFILSAKAQDSLKTVTSTPEKKAAQAPAKTDTRPAAKAVNKQPQQTPATSKIPTKPVVAPSPAKPIDNSLNGQYEDLLKHSWMQQGYKVVQPARLASLWKSVNDSINYHKKVSAEAKQKISEQEKLIAELKNVDKEEKASEYPQATVVNEIQVLGMTIDTGTYNWIVWGTILILALALAGILFSTTKNSSDSKHHKQLYDELSSEYQSYKAKAKEKELKLARELQTERNTIEELLAAKKNEDDSGKNNRR